jgi:hypothetical protein
MAPRLRANKGDKKEMKKAVVPQARTKEYGGISQRLQLTEVGKRDEFGTSFVSELGTAVGRRWYLGWPTGFGSNGFVDVFFLNLRFTTESAEQGTISNRS